MMLTNIVPRDGWHAMEPRGEMDALKTPVKHVLFIHTETESCTTHEECALIVRRIQEEHMSDEVEAPDIMQSFLIGGNGWVYEGRGWHMDPQRHFIHEYLKGLGIEIAYIGDYDEIGPPPNMLEAARNLIFHGINNNLITSSYDCTHLA